jgi:apolipoprotein N-acyltransferase
MANHAAPELLSQAGGFVLSFAVITCAAQIHATRKWGASRSFTSLLLVTLLGSITSMLGQLAELNLLPLVWLLVCASMFQFCRRPAFNLALFMVCSLLLLAVWQPFGKRRAEDKGGLIVAGVQLEFPNNQQVLNALDQARARFSDAQLFMLSEYTFLNPVPPEVRDWCASNQIHLVVGGKEPLGETNFYNMAYVIGTNGAIVHQQVKSVPIQFFKDGLPAPERKVWDSPWGKLGILTCYDLSYTRVVDDFVRQGAIALLNPTMDVADWGAHQHELHSRVAPIRAAEYGIPIFRVASSGISQLVTRGGRVIASAPFPGEGEIIGGPLPLSAKPRLPLDRWLAPACVGITVLALLASLIPFRKTTANAYE